MDQDHAHMNTPRSNARRNERDARTLDTPERRRIPAGPRLDLPPQPFPLPVAALPVGPPQFNDPFQNNYAPAPVYHHLPVNLAQAAANLPPLLPARGRGRGRPRGRANYNQNHIWAPVQNLPAIPPVSVDLIDKYITVSHIYNTACCSCSIACSCFAFQYS